MKLSEIIIIAWQKGQLSEGKAARLIGVDRLTLRTMRDELHLEGNFIMQLETCPFCGGDAKLVHISPTNSVQSDEYRVECGDCGSCGRACDDKDRAVYYWNHGEFQQETFEQAVINDPEMTYEQKKYWLLQCRPTKRALDLLPCGHSASETVLNTVTKELSCGVCGASQ